MKILNATPLKVAWVVASSQPPALSATWIVKGTYKLVPGGVAQDVPEPDFPSGDLPYPGGPEGSVKYEGDFAPLKFRTDLMLVGTCHAPGGKPTSVCRVEFAVGGYRKDLAVIGDRLWKPGLLGSRMSDPMDFTKMPLAYDRAFGGPGYAPNPHGKGHDALELPNVENPRSLLTHRGDDVDPSGFGPIPRGWAQRQKGLGSYKGAWLKERWPWFPKDFDWTHFNAAPADQQPESPLKGDELVVLTNLHPQHPRYECRLPGIRPQVFVATKDRVTEAPLKLDTLWIDADEEKLVLVWRGQTAAPSLKMPEIDGVHVVTRKLADAPLTWTEYRARMDGAAAKEQKAAEDADAKEKAEADADKAEFAKMDADIAKVEEGLKKEASEMVADLSAHNAGSGLPALTPYENWAPLPPDPAPIAAMWNEATKDADVARGLKDLKAPEEPQLPDADEDDPVWTRERVVAHAKVGGSFAEQDLAGLDLSGIGFAGLDFKGASLTGATLEGATFEKAILSRADLSKAKAASATFAGADLSRADFTAAVLTEAVFTGAKADRATFVEAVLAEAILESLQADRADFTKADLTRAVLRGGHYYKTNFGEATVEDANFSRAFLEHAQFEGAKGARSIFDGADLTGLHAGNSPQFPEASFKEVRAEGSYWAGATLEKADFRRAQLARADFETANLKKARLDAADLRKAVLEGATLDGASLLATNLFQASLQRASLRLCDLRRANLYESDLWDVVVDGAQLDGANLQMTKLAGKS